jgi:ATPase family associated with various cellular activities (AAA)
LGRGRLCRTEPGDLGASARQARTVYLAWERCGVRGARDGRPAGCCAGDRAYPFSVGTARPAHLETRPELADAGRLARRLLRRAVAAARTEDAPVQRALWEHLGPDAADVPVVRATWPGYDRVNVQVGLDAWLAAPGRGHELAGITGFHPGPGLADLVQNEQWRGVRMGSPATDLLPAGPGGETVACLQCALCLVTDGQRRLALLIQAAGPEAHVDAACADAGRARQVIGEIRRLAIERNVFRGHVIGFGGEVFGPRRQELLSFLERPEVGREQVILPPDLLERIERQVVGVARHVSWLRASGQHLKRGVLLHGPPGTGKTHTVRYLLGQMPGVTVVVLTGAALGRIAAACSVARTLQPSMVVVEDVDLIAEQRESRGGQHPLLFQLLNEMDGLGEDADVTFLLTTNRADLLEPALAQRPGRVDHAAGLPLPDADARRRLIRLYQHDLVLDLTSPAAMIARTEGVTASFLKELLRRAAIYAAEDAARQGPGAAADRGDAAGAPLTVRDAHMNAALDELLDSRDQLTLALLGGRAAQRPPASPEPVTP